jgi:hypothetical protein
MTKTMTSWIETADERQFCQAVMFERMPASAEIHHLHLGSRIFSLSSRIAEALSYRRANRSANG